MATEQLTEAFNNWWNEEGKFMTPDSTNLEETKMVMLIAWLNGADTATNEIRG